MGRVEQRKQIRKKRKRARFLIICLLIFMILGLVATDYAIREMLAIEESRVIGFTRELDNYKIYFMGEEFFIEYDRIEQVREEIYSFSKDQIEGIQDWIGNRIR